MKDAIRDHDDLLSVRSGLKRATRQPASHSCGVVILLGLIAGYNEFQVRLASHGSLRRPSRQTRAHPRRRLGQHHVYRNYGLDAQPDVDGWSGADVSVRGSTDK